MSMMKAMMLVSREPAMRGSELLLLLASRHGVQRMTKKRQARAKVRAKVVEQPARQMEHSVKEQLRW